MDEINSYYVPKVSDKLSITTFDNKSFLICIDDKKPIKFKIGLYAKLMLDQVDGRKNISEIVSSFNSQIGSNFSDASVISIFKNQFLGYGILDNDTTQNIKIKDNYLQLRFVLFPENLVKKMISPLLFLFDKTLYKGLFIAFFAFTTVFYIRDIKFIELYFGFTSTFGLWFIALYSLSHIFHEMGHAGACIKYGARSGPIGFGFYFLMPVLFADVSDAWRLKKSERLIIDFAGIYMQVIFCALFVIIYLLIGDRFFLNMSFLITTTLYSHINPFFRYDGYWALSDAINVPNLRGKSNNALKQLMLFLFKKQSNWKHSRLNYFFVGYSILCLLFLFWFIVFMIIFKRNAILYFPVDLYNFFYNLIMHFNTITFTWLKDNLLSFILPFTFYFILYRYSKRIFPFISLFIKSRKSKEIKLA